MLLIVIFNLALGIAATTAEERPYYDIEKAELLFEDFIVTYDKSYNNITEKELRFIIFKDNLIEINKKNSDNLSTFGINHFTDLTTEEVIRYHTGYKPHFSTDSVCKNISDKDVISENAPASINWVEKGAVTPPKNQGRCGGCWAFATIGNIEGQYFIKNNKLVSFSEQELIDCSKNNGGCGGGLMVTALTDLIAIGGLETEENYPFAGRNQQCKYNSAKAVAKVIGCENYLLKDEDKLKEVLATKGPIIIGVNGDDLIAYSNGVLRKAHCSDDIQYQNHAVLLVGYGTENGVDYWLIKNSWSKKWGLGGYCKIHRGDNTCGIVTDNQNSSANL